MLIKMTAIAASADGVYLEGKEYDVDDKAAKAFIKGGYAEAVSAVANNHTAGQAGTADGQQPEQPTSNAAGGN